jgi:hypothetical protein
MGRVPSSAFGTSVTHNRRRARAADPRESPNRSRARHGFVIPLSLRQFEIVGVLKGATYRRRSPWRSLFRLFRNGRSGLGNAYRIRPSHALFQTLFKFLLF